MALLDLLICAPVIGSFLGMVLSVQYRREMLWGAGCFAQRFIMLGLVLGTQILYCSGSSSPTSSFGNWDHLQCSGTSKRGFIQLIDKTDFADDFKNNKKYYFVPFRDFMVNITDKTCQMEVSQLYTGAIDKMNDRDDSVFTLIEARDHFPHCSGDKGYGPFQNFLNNVLTKMSGRRSFILGLMDDTVYKDWDNRYKEASFDRKDSAPSNQLGTIIRESGSSLKRVHFMMMHPDTSLTFPVSQELNAIKRNDSLMESQRYEEINRLIFSDSCIFSRGKDSTDDNDALKNFSKTSVLFVSVSFIILMVISLAWLVFYYVQRFRYAHAKDRLARRLFNAAKKALTKIPTRVLKHGEPELDTDCPVCIEPYVCGDVIRILPCKHVFHKTCVDPWLLEHRTCPMCKGDILKAFGYKFAQMEDSGHGAGYEDGRVSVDGQSSSDGQGSSSSVGGSYAAYPFPGNITDSDIHDPFFPSPAPSPSLVQQVMHPSNAAGFSIIPLTVHSTTISRPSTTANQNPTGNAARTSLAGIAGHSDSSSEMNEESPDPLLTSFKQHHSAEVHHPPLEGGDTSSSPTDSHGHSASCESSSDSDSCLGGASSLNRAAAAPLLHRQTPGDQLFQPRPSTAPASKDLSSQFQTRSRSAGNGPLSPPKKKSKAGKLKRRQSAGATNPAGTVVPMSLVKVADTGKTTGPKSKKETGGGTSSGPGASGGSRKESKGKFSVKRPSTAKTSVVIGTLSDLGSLESI